MTQQQIQLKIESFLKYADKRLLDSFPLPGGRMRLFAANPVSYACNYAVINQWLDVDETIEAAEEEFLGREISPCRFYGAPDSVDLEQLRPAFARHGYSIKVMEQVHMMALTRPACQVESADCQLYWQQQELSPQEQEFILQNANGEFALQHIQRELRRGCGKMLFAIQQENLVAGLLYAEQADTAMLSDDYTKLDYNNFELVQTMIVQATTLCQSQGKKLLFARVKGQKALKCYQTIGFEPIPTTPIWWAVKGKLPLWLEEQ